MIPQPDGMPSPNVRAHQGKLNEDEYGFILDTTLKPKHRGDPKVLEFIDNFIRCKNIAQASAECGVHTSLGYKWRHRKDISNAIQKLIDKSSVKHGFDSSEILERAKEIVDFDPIAVQNPDGSFKSNLHDMSPEARRNIKKLKVKNLYQESKDINGIKDKIIIGQIIEYDFYDKLKSIELTGREKEMFKNTTKVQHDIPTDMKKILLESERRGTKLIESNTKDVIDAEYRQHDS